MLYPAYKKTSQPENCQFLVFHLVRKSIVPEQTIQPHLAQEFINSCCQFKRILEGSGFVKLNRLVDKDLKSSKDKAGLIEKYCYLLERENQLMVKDISFKNGMRVSGQHCQFTHLNPELFWHILLLFQNKKARKCRICGPWCVL